MSDTTPPETGTPVRIDLEKVESWKSVAHVTVEPSHLEGFRDKAARKLAKKIRLDGFRPGKVPVAVVRKRLPGEVEQEAIEGMIPEIYRQLLSENEDLHPISDPRVENFDMPEDEPIRFDLVVETRPDLEIQGIEAVEATRHLPPVTDERVEEALEDLRQRHAHWHERTEGGVEEGDAVLMDTVPLDAEGNPIEDEKEEDQPLLVGGEGMLPEITAALIGMQNGEETDVEVNYPVDYPNEELRGTIRRIRLKVKEVRQKHVHGLDDEFAQHHTEFETIGELRADVRKHLERSFRRESDRGLRQQLVERLLAINPVPVPPSLEQRYLNAIVNDILRNQFGNQFDPDALTQEQRDKLAEAYRPMAQQSVRRMILVDNLRRSLQIEVGDDELDARVAELAEEQGTTPERIRGMLDRGRGLERLRDEIEEDKVFAYLEEKAKVTVTEELPEPPPNVAGGVSRGDADDAADPENEAEAEGK